MIKAVERRALRLARSRTFLRQRAALRRAGASEQQVEFLGAILLAELTARPADVRLLEWGLALVLRTGVLGGSVRRRGNALTVGPYQLRGARLFHVASDALAELRRWEVDDLETAARRWNGAPGDTYMKVCRLAVAVM